MLQTVLDKQSNLCVALDCNTAAEILRLADMIGPEVVAMKLHRDVVFDWTNNTSEQLKELSAKHNFLLFEDRKLADIGNTVRLQAKECVEWADLVTVHGVAAPGTLEGLQRACPE